MANDRDRLYCYPNSNVLINRFDVRDQAILTKIENELSTYRLAELHSSPVYGRFDMTHLKEIHHHLFKDVYPFAGKLRVVDIAKGNTYFCRADFIPDEGHRIFEELQRDHALSGASYEDFVRRAAYYLGEINMLHPFREGNGRTQREFVRSLGLHAGYEIDWTRIPRERFVEVSIQSAHESNRGFEEVLRDSISNRQPMPVLSELFRGMDRGRER